MLIYWRVYFNYFQAAVVRYPINHRILQVNSASTLRLRQRGLHRAWTVIVHDNPQ